MLAISSSYSIGVGVIDAKEDLFLRLNSSKIDVSVESQVARVKSAQAFFNQTDNIQEIKYSFPLPVEASAVQLRWEIDGVWYTANMSATPDSSNGNNNENSDKTNLSEYLGDNPLNFEIEHEINPGTSIKVELTYVEFLNYKFGNVDFKYKNDYALIQPDYINTQEFNFNLISERTIQSILLLSHSENEVNNDGNIANIGYERIESPATTDYHVQYSLSLDELGLFSLSSYIPYSDVPDDYGNGFFLFVAEPDADKNAKILNKVFTLIIDKSGSMGGSKIVQARNAAKFIVENLNEGDKFNIVDFEGNVSSFRQEHVEYNPATEAEALQYISNINAGGSTNISDALGKSISQFSVADSTTANIIIFFTNGEASSGITDTDGILNYVENKINQNETGVMIFTFGIGNSVNTQLLSLLASENNGLSDFLENHELETKISEFYLMIRNPVLLDTKVAFSPSIIKEIYPKPLPNLYKGQQMLVVGRYSEPVSLNVDFSGEAFGKPVNYSYGLELSSEDNMKYRFLTKVWA